jgi:uncharacterized protein (DUF58 family)
MRIRSCSNCSRNCRHREADVSRFLDPAVLGAISGLDLVAKTVVEGFVAGLHRSADFGFSHEFAEYRAYTPGDDPRNIDWNVFARSDRTYVKRFRGETNSLLTLLLDASNSMNFTSHSVNKMNYARFMAAAIFYLALRKQRDAAGLLVFDDAVRNYVRPSTRHGQLLRLLSGLELAEPRARTNFVEPLRHLQGFLNRRGIVLMLSDFFAAPRTIIRALEPLRYHGSEVVLFHILDPKEIRPELNTSTVLVDLETRARIEVTAEYAAKDYTQRIAQHIEALREAAQRAGMSYQLLVTDRPLDDALREYLTLRQGRP